MGTHANHGFRINGVEYLTYTNMGGNPTDLGIYDYQRWATAWRLSETEKRVQEALRPSMLEEIPTEEHKRIFECEGEVSNYFELCRNDLDDIEGLLKEGIFPEAINFRERWNYIMCFETGDFEVWSGDQLIVSININCPLEVGERILKIVEKNGL